MPTELTADCANNSDVEATRMTVEECVRFCDEHIDEFPLLVNGRRVKRVSDSHRWMLMQSTAGCRLKQKTSAMDLASHRLLFVRALFLKMIVVMLV